MRAFYAYRIEQNFGESPQFAKFFSPTFPMKHVVIGSLCRERTTREARHLNIV